MNPVNPFSETESRLPAVSGTFYPGEKERLGKAVTELLETAEPGPPLQKSSRLKGLIVPHAGYVYSGSVAAAAYRYLRQAPSITDIVLAGPAHRTSDRGIFAHPAEMFLTPLGAVRVNNDLVNRLTEKKQIESSGRAVSAHRDEHSLEVQLPFIQKLLPQARIIPLLFSAVESEKAADIFRELNAPGVLFIISTDLSHFHNLDDAEKIDTETDRLIMNYHYNEIEPQRACGTFALSGFLKYAAEEGFTIARTARATSADNGGPPERVVGYASYIITENEPD